MKVSVDMKNLRFMHKHPNVQVIANLAWLEANAVPYVVSDPDTKSFLNDLTDMELKILYRNTTGSDTGWLGSSLRAILADLVNRMPDADVNPYEVERQAAVVVQGDGKFYRYAKGSFTPAVLQSLFTDCLKSTKSESEPTVAAKGRAQHVDSRVTLTPARVAPPPPRGAARVAATPAQPVARPTAPPRQGGVREIIWKIADELWGKHGKPTDKKEVLNLRKNIMDVLENDHQVKRNTSSNELGNWQKTRVPT